MASRFGLVAFALVVAAALSVTGACGSVVARRVDPYAQRTAVAQQCPNGMEASADTAGQCCWRGQAWSSVRGACVGAPVCPLGMVAQGETCAVAAAPAVGGCPGGQTIGPDTAGHCCWPAQAWSAMRGVCVGVPACPTGTQASGEACVAYGR